MDINSNKKNHKRKQLCLPIGNLSKSQYPIHLVKPNKALFLPTRKS